MNVSKVAALITLLKIFLSALMYLVLLFWGHRSLFSLERLLSFL